MTTGRELIRAIQSIGERNVRSCAAALDREASTVASLILEAHGQGPEDALALAKVLRNRNALQRPDLKLDFPWLTKNLSQVMGEEHILKLEELSSKAHQARTQAAYLSAMLRPFDPKYLYLWRNERHELKLKEVESRIQYLESMEISDVESVIEWGDQVAELFKDVIVVDDETMLSPMKRPFGTVSAKSSRTYLQSWNAFIRRNREMLRDPAALLSLRDLEKGSESTVLTAAQRARLVSKMSDAQYQRQKSALALQTNALGYEVEQVQATLAEAAKELQKALEENRRLKEQMSSPARFTEAQIEEEVRRVKESKPEIKPGLELFADSSSGQSSSCYFKDLSGADEGINRWVETLKLMWGGGSESATFKAHLKIDDGELIINLPKWKLDEAKSKLVSLNRRLTGENKT